MNIEDFKNYPKVNFADIKMCPHCGQTQEEHEGSSIMYQDNHTLLTCVNCDGTYISYLPIYQNDNCGYVVMVALGSNKPDRFFQVFLDENSALEYAKKLVNADNKYNSKFISAETIIVYYNRKFYGEDIRYAWNDTSVGDKYMIRKIYMD